MKKIRSASRHKKLPRTVSIPLAIMGVLLLCMGLMMALRHRASAPAMETLPSLNQDPTNPTPTSAEDPLLISAIRARSYPGSALTREQSLGDQSGYTNTVVSYLSDGLKINALMSVPNGSAPAGGWPVVIFNHGYINPTVYTTTGSEYSQFIATLARAGYVVIKPDYRGHGQSQGIAAGGHFSPVYTYDVLNLIASLKQDDFFNPSRIGQVGHSMGGHAAVRTAVVSRDVKATVLLAGVVGSFSDIFYNWPNSPMASDLPVIAQTNKRDYVAKYGEPRANPSFWEKASALTYAGDFSGAIQVNHDSGNSIVPLSFSEHLTSALRSAGKTVDYRTYPGDDHQFATNRSAVLQNMVSFFQSNL